MKFNGIELTVAILVRRIQRAAFNISVYLGVSSNRSPLARTQSVRLKTNSDRRYLTVQKWSKGDVLSKRLEARLSKHQ